jgi:UDP-N-acetylmuramate--alanine ligase
MSIADPLLAVRYRALALQALGRPGPDRAELPERFLVVDVQRQRLGLLEAGRLTGDFAISTAAAGLGGADGSLRTPPGWHRIQARIGAGAPSGTVFRDRVATGEVWHGQELDDDLILTRILTLDGLEPGVNRGPGCDSLERTIYLHGTNQLAELGTPASHGCMRMAGADVVELFERVREGDLLLVAASSADPLGLGRLHFAGAAGSGMSALAQYVAQRGGRASGSDRSFDRGLNGAGRALLERAGVALFPQDGSGVAGDCAAVVYSTAVEAQVADFARAQALGIPLVHRSELLAHFVAERRTLAITGTSGKSTTVAMVFEILRGAGRDPSVITGGELVALQRQGLWGNAWAGASDLLVVEADESDGSVVRYHPAVGAILNLQRDHKEMAEVAAMFAAFRGQAREGFVVGEAANLAPFAQGATVFGFGSGAQVRAEDAAEGGDGSSFRVAATRFRLNVPGRHNVENALAAIAVCAAVGVPLAAMVAPLERFQGVARRFQVLGAARGVEVVDDFGHNPAKVAASIRTAHLRAGRVLAVFQPHGYGPMRFLRADFVDTFAAELRPEDRLWLLEIFYAGGTAMRDLSSAQVALEIAQKGVQARFAPTRAGLVAALAQEARPGDLILVMGARDPSLTGLAWDILAALDEGTADGEGRPAMDRP